MLASRKEQFEAAVEIVKHLPKEGAVTTSSEEKLAFYSLFKQSTIGRCNIKKPSMWNVVESYKWNSWNALGELSSEEAMDQYLQKLRIKIDTVNATHNVEDWMSGDLYIKMKPLLEKIGSPLGKSEQTSSEARTLTSLQDSSKKLISVYQIGNISQSTTDVTTVGYASSIVSDSEYCDAIDEDVQTRSRTSSYEIHDHPKIKSSETGKKIQEQLQIISERIEVLSRLMETRNNQLLNVFKKATVYIFLPKKVSWINFLLFLIWPFVAHILIRYVKRFLRF